MPSGTSLIEPSQVPSTVGFQRGSKAGRAPLPWHRSAPTGTGTAWGALASHHTAGVHAARFVSAEQEAKQNIWIRILSTNTQNKHNCNTERRSQLFFPLNMKRVLEPPVMLSMASCLHCHPTPPVP